ncbi:hypothetical protein, partial [Planktotalea arctica]|uniref:hypothetical protein n=1 Tax=Planktotalea arctica TaxID=1481893 RepID=UPI00321A6027
IIAQAEPILVAIDIAQARHEVLIAAPGKKRRRGEAECATDGRAFSSATREAELGRPQGYVFSFR